MKFKDQKKCAETHTRSKVTLPVIRNIMLEKEPEKVWELLDEYLNTVCEKKRSPSILVVPIIIKNDPNGERS